jgi:murein DD-endopeptidase MepM/ murein hydrolase activator NlpD
MGLNEKKCLLQGYGKAFFKALPFDVWHTKFGCIIAALDRIFKSVNLGYMHFCRYAALLLGRLLGMRQRYFLTRSGSMRLRYIAAPVTAFVLTTAFFPGSGHEISNTYRQSQREVVSRRALTNHFSYSYRADSIRKPEASLKVIPLVEDPDTLETKSSDLARPVAYTANKNIGRDVGIREENIRIGAGDTISAVLQKSGMNSSDTFKAVTAMKDHFDPRKVKPGQSVHVKFAPDEKSNGNYRFSELRLMIDPVRFITVEQQDENSFVSKVHEKQTHVRLHAQKAKIQNSLFGSALKAGIPSEIIAETIRIYSWDVDFQRDIRRGDTLEILYESLVTEDGSFAKYGKIIYANLSVGSRPIPVYRFETDRGDVDYFEPNGQSVRKALMKTPVDGARLSSDYGLRKHPVLGYNKMHKGQDFAAPRGTPIYAAGDGVVEKASRWGSYGNYMRIRHNSTLKTAYAHIQRFAKGMAAGKRVKQGQVVAYIGSTGRSTGPHLHYEVLLNGEQVNPSTIKLPKGKTLTGQNLQKFREMVKKRDSQYKTMADSLELAGKSQGKGVAAN